MGLARALCISLIILGVLLAVADLNEARRYGHTLVTVGAERHLWQWGLACIISGVLGIVALAASDRPNRADTR